MRLFLIKIDAVLRKKGIFGLLKLVIRKFLLLIKFYSTILRWRKDGFVSRFDADGGITIDLIPVSYVSVLRNYLQYTNSVSLAGRTMSEPLLRCLVSVLYQKDFINSNLAIVDIGAWIGDNSLVWAKMLRQKGNGCVFAIDPSEENLRFIQDTAKHNSICNIVTVCAVCSDQSGQKMNFSGSLNHASFSTGGAGYDSGLVSTTLDDILVETHVGLLHLDVEGLEFEVLRGAGHTVKCCRPVVIFEQHLNDDNPKEITNWLSQYGYVTKIINERLIENKADCRNFISFPAEFSLGLLMEQLGKVELVGHVPLEAGQPILLPVEVL